MPNITLRIYIGEDDIKGWKTCIVTYSPPKAGSADYTISSITQAPLKGRKSASTPREYDLKRALGNNAISDMIHLALNPAPPAEKKGKKKERAWEELGLEERSKVWAKDKSTPALFQEEDLP